MKGKEEPLSEHSLAIQKSIVMSITDPAKLFRGDLDFAREDYLKLSKRWHPDRPMGDKECFSKIAALYEEAQRRLRTNTWNGLCVVTFRDAAGHVKALPQLAGFDGHLGRVMVLPDETVHLMEPANKSFIRNAERFIGKFRYGSDRMKHDVERCLPRSMKVVAMSDGRIAARLQRPTDVIRLRDVVKHYQNMMDPRHVAWIVSSLMNLACYLEWHGRMHGDISPDTYYISPEHHSGILLDGWWFSMKVGDRVTSIPQRTLDVAPFDLRVHKAATPTVDHELIRLTAREISNLKVTPKPMLGWMNSIAKGKAVDQYRTWSEVLVKSFGPRRFTPMALTVNDVYA